MTTAARAQRRLSTRLSRKGALIEETYMIFQVWDRQQDLRTNLARIKNENPVGASNAAWLREIIATLSSRFQNEDEILPLVVLAQGRLPLELWRPCLLWHIGQQDELFHVFLTQWLYPAHEEGVYRIRTEDVVPFVIEQTAGRLAGGKGLSEYGRVRAARDLLLMAADFGLLKGKVVREFAAYHLSDESLLYVLHAMAEREPSPQRLIESHDWRMFLMATQDVECELLRLHQYRRVEYQAAGSLVQIALPYPSLLAYSRSLVE